MPAFTSYAEVRTDSGDARANLRIVLEQLGNISRGGGQIVFHRMANLHFASWFVLDGIDCAPPRLVLETNYDGDLRDHLDQLIRYGASTLNRIYCYCKNMGMGCYIN